MKFENLITIGTLAKITNVKVKALRYYDKIGILIPAYVNPRNGYRYYTRNHIYLIDAIHLCAQLHIPLCEFKNYISEDGTQIQTSVLIEQGIQKATNKIGELQEMIRLLEEVQDEIKKSEQIRKSEQISNADDMQEDGEERLVKTGEEDYWLTPYEGSMTEEEYYSLLTEAYLEIEKNQLPLSERGEDGMILIEEGGKQTTYIYVSLKKDDRNREFDNIMTIPAASYVHRTTYSTDIKKARDHFPVLFLEAGRKIVFQVEMFTEVFDSNAPLFEIRCSLPVKNI